jgi:hypothetical protein
MLRELGYQTSARDVSIAWSSVHSMTIAFAPPQPDRPGRLVIIDPEAGLERAERWEWAEFEGDQPA